MCDEFRANAVDIIGRSLPDIQRVFFVHIPRTGGTSLERSIEQAGGGFLWHTSFSSIEWLEVESGKRHVDALTYVLSFLAQFERPEARLYVVGHDPLASILARGRLRAGDIAFSIIRDPALICISALNYIIDTVRRDTGRPDSADWGRWLNALGCTSVFQPTMERSDVQRILHSDRFREEYRNLTAKMISLDGTAQGFHDAIALSGCEFLTPENMRAWVRTRLDLTLETEWRNKSSGNIKELLDEDDHQFIKTQLCDLDLPLYEELLARYVWRAEDATPRPSHRIMPTQAAVGPH